jgi:hypothetical protein
MRLSGIGQAQTPTPNQADFDTCNREAQTRATSPAASPGGTTGATGVTPAPPPPSNPSRGVTSRPPTDPSTGGSSTGRAASPDSSLTGISGAGQSDPAYQQAYRDCLKRRGF